MLKPELRKIIRHKLDKHRNLQNFISSIYLKYCHLVGFSHILPDFLIIGFPKCGTTSLYNYLIEHPQILSPLGKEIDFFDRLYNKGLNWYQVRFSTKLEKSFKKSFLNKTVLSGEATPRYVFSPHARYRIKETIPDSKFIILLRNPVDRAYSHWNMNLHNGYEYLSFENALEKESKRIENRFFKMAKDPNYYSWNYDLFGYLEQGKYIQHIKPWFEIFNKKQFLIIQSEDFLENPQKVYHQTLEFLNLDKWEPESYQPFKKRIYENPQIDSDLHAKLNKFFHPYNEQLYKFLGKTFDWK